MAKGRAQIYTLLQGWGTDSITPNPAHRRKYLCCPVPNSLDSLDLLLVLLLHGVPGLPHHINSMQKQTKIKAIINNLMCHKGLLFLVSRRKQWHRFNKLLGQFFVSGTSGFSIAKLFFSVIP